MSDATRQNSYAFQLLSGKARLLAALDFGDVFDHGNSMNGPAFSIADQGCSQVDPDSFTILAHISLAQLERRYVAPKEPIGKLYIRGQVIRVRDVAERQLQEFRFRIPYHSTKRAV